MIVVRYATLVALVVWLGVLTRERFGAWAVDAATMSYACGGATLVGLFVMKFVGPPPASFVGRAAIAATMLALTAAATLSRAVPAAPIVTINLALGLVLLFWYVRE